METGARATQVKPDSGSEYFKEEDVEVKSDTDPLMAAAAYSPPFTHWGRDPIHLMIDASPLLQFESSGLGTVAVKEDPWATTGLSQTATTPQTTRTPHSSRTGRGRGPRTSSGNTTTASVESLRDPDDPRDRGTDNGPQNLMETSTDSESGDWSLAAGP